MPIGNFREGKEAEEAKETKEQSQELDIRPRNQILQTPEDYDDDFDNLMDEEKDSGEANEEGSDYSIDRGEQNDKKSFLERIKSFFGENNESKNQTENDKNDDNSDIADENKLDSSNDEHTNFVDSLKTNMSPDEVKAYNAEHGVGDIPKRQPGGFERERERTFEFLDPRDDSEGDDASENKEKSSNDIA